jgi:hypothetical protein
VNETEQPQPPVIAEPREGLRLGLPWERQEPGMTPGGLMQTVRLLLFTATEAFQMMRRDGVMTAPIVFLVALGTVGTFFGLLWQSWARAMAGALGGGNLQTLMTQNSLGVMSFVLAPFFVTLFALLAAVMHHAFLLLLGGAPRPLHVTLRVVCYAWGANYVWMLIPVCGTFIGTVWGAVLTVVGLREAHGIPGGRAVAAVLVPYLLAACCLFATWSLVTASMLASL